MFRGNNVVLSVPYKDKDVARLQDFQELELVLTRSDSSPFWNTAAALMEQPCYKSRASKLTY